MASHANRKTLRLSGDSERNNVKQLLSGKNLQHEKQACVLLSVADGKVLRSVEDGNQWETLSNVNTILEGAFTKLFMVLSNSLIIFGFESQTMILGILHFTNIGLSVQIKLRHLSAQKTLHLSHYHAVLRVTKRFCQLPSRHFRSLGITVTFVADRSIVC